MRKKKIITMMASNEPAFNDKEMATYKCADCGGYTAIQSSLSEPFCISCGSDNLDGVDNMPESEITFESEDDLLSAKCVECNVYNILTKEQYSKCDSGDGYITLHCPVCSKENKWSDTGENSIFTLSSKEGRILCKKFDENELATITCDSCNEDAIMTLDYAKESASSSGIGTVRCPSCSEDIVFKEDTFSGEDSEKLDDDIDNDDDDTDIEDAAGAGKSIDDLDDDDDKESDIEDTGDANIQNVDMIKSSNADSLYAVSNDVIVARLSVADKTDSEVDALIGALSLAFKDNNTVDVLVNNGFDIVDSSDNSFVDVGEIRSKYDKDIDTYKEVLFQSIGIAACGINRKVFQEENPLYNELVKGLSAHVSESDAEVIVANAFAKSSDEYVELLRDTAIEVANKSDDVRNELSRTIMGMSIPVVSNVPDSSVESRLLKPVQGQGIGRRTVMSNGKQSKVVQMSKRSLLFNKAQLG